MGHRLRGNAILRFDPATEAWLTFELESQPAEVRQLLGALGEVWGAESAADQLVVVRDLRVIDGAQSGRASWLGSGSGVSTIRRRSPMPEPRRTAATVARSARHQRGRR